ncbi:MAG: hypothetical protein AAFU54_29980 [Chloroflexota bacterium]
MTRNTVPALGLSQEVAGEVDFIINYDIKYRMGNDLFEEEE